MAKTSKKPAVAKHVDAAPAPQVALEPVQLTIADLQMLSRIVDLASRRGAFQGSELSQVGESFNKLTGFLAYVESTQAKEAAPAEAEAEVAAPAVESEQAE